MVTDTISTGTMSRMITESIATINVECPLLLGGVDHICLGSKMTGVNSVWGEELRSTPGNQASTRDPSSCKAWSIGTEFIEVAMTEMRPLAAESMFQGQNVSAGLSEPR